MRYFVVQSVATAVVRRNKHATISLRNTHDNYSSLLVRNPSSTSIFNIAVMLERSLYRILSSSLPSKNVKIIILPVVLYGWEIWSIVLREENRLFLHAGLHFVSPSLHVELHYVSLSLQTTLCVTVFTGYTMRYCHYRLQYA
jgi:hypothetical protein